MADISKELSNIADAVYGKDMRSALHDSIQKVNNDVGNKVNKTDYASTDKYGLVKLWETGGLYINTKNCLAIQLKKDFGLRFTDGCLIVDPAKESEVLNGEGGYKPVVPETLAKVTDSIKSAYTAADTALKSEVTDAYTAAIEKVRSDSSIIFLSTPGAASDSTLASVKDGTLNITVPQINRRYIWKATEDCAHITVNNIIIDNYPYSGTTDVKLRKGCTYILRTTNIKPLPGSGNKSLIAVESEMSPDVTDAYEEADKEAIKQAYNQVTDDYAEILSLNDHAEMRDKEIFLSYGLGYEADTDFGIRLLGNLNAISVEADTLRVYDTGREDWENITYASIGYWDDAATKAHAHSNMDVLDDITEERMKQWDESLSNANFYNSNSQGYASLDELAHDTLEAFNRKHIHTNKDVLDDITEEKVNAWNNPPTATTSTYGMVKLSSKGGISYAEGLTVNTNAEYGTGRTSDGKVVVKAATEEEIKAGTQEYKPIVPATFKKALVANGCITDDNFSSKNPTKGYNSLDDLAIDTADAFEGVQALTRYDETPQEIGTWINGTPIWRMAFKYKFDEIDIKDIENDNQFYIVNFVAEKLNTPNGIILNYMVTLAIDIDSPSFIDDITLAIDGTFGGAVKIDKSMWSGNSSANPGIYGYIEFVTPADNIKNN